MKRYNVTHETRYAYEIPVTLGLHTTRISPPTASRQKLIDHAIDVVPPPSWSMAFMDHFGNSLHHIAVQTAHETFAVTQRTVVEVTAPEWKEIPPGPAWESVRDAVSGDAFPDDPQVAEFIYPSPLIPHDDAAAAFIKKTFVPGAPIARAALEVAKRFKSDFTYEPGATTIATSVPEIMENRKGVCQDFAHAMISGLRTIGLPARYVSGYLKTYRAASAKPEEKALVGADATHAWVSVWCGADLGWLEFDPTNALAVGDEHIVVAYGRDFNDVTPLRGVIMGGGPHTLDVAVTVELMADE